MATLEDTLSQADPLERVGWLVYSANWYERKADRYARQPAASEISDAEAREFAGYASVLRQQADVELQGEINRRVMNSIDQVRWWQRRQVRHRVARADRELEKTAATMAEDGRSAAVAEAGAREAPVRLGKGVLDASIGEKAQRLVALRLSAYVTGGTRDAKAANEAHALLNQHLNLLARKEIARNDLHQNQSAPRPGATTFGLRRPTRSSADPRTDSTRTSTTSTDQNNGTQRNQGFHRQHGNF
ncbi:hypothetical protein ACPA54_33405 [Uniformispora flossi]|uniref:hypothetical protein n=1 Tax=Uniformispora flossi TaxID=3390723 RepID=UPI003C2AE7AA